MGRREERAPRGWILAVAAITALAAIPRIVAATHGLFGDEIYTLAIAQRDSLGDALSGVNETENTPPLYYVLAWAAARIGDDPELTRLPALLCGLAAVPVVGLLGRRVYGNHAGVVAAAIVAANPFAVYYSSEARAFAPVFLAVSLAALALLEALRTRQRVWWLALTLAVASGLWLHYLAALPLAAQAAWAFAVRPDCRRQVVLAHGGALVLFVPWLPFLNQNAPLLGMFEPSQVVDYPLRVLLGWPYADAAEVPGLAVIGGFALVLAAVTAAGLRAPAMPRLGQPGTMLLAAALATPAGLLAYSAVGDGIFFARNLIVALPAVAVLLAGLITRRPLGIALPASVLTVALMLPTSARVAFDDLRRPPYDEVAAYLDEHLAPADVIVYEPVTRARYPQRLTLAAFLRRPHVRLYGLEGAAAGWRAGLRGARVYWLHTDLTTPPSTLVDRRFSVVSRREWHRRNGGLVLVEFRPQRSDE